MQSIPYDPALVLGNIVDDEVLKRVLAVSEAGAPADAAQAQLNALIQAKRSLGMTIDELTGMGIEPLEAIAAGLELDKKISAAAASLATKTIEAQDKIVKAMVDRAAVPVSASVESPLDYGRTQIKPLPISADSLKMDVQYFSNDENVQGSTTTSTKTSVAIKGYVEGFFDGVEGAGGEDMAESAQAQASSQYQNHDVAGTLVITAACTHRMAQILEPLVIDPDKGIRVWNTLFPGDRIRPNDPASLAKIALQENTKKDDKGLRIVSGATYGSSFVGMVHILRAERTMSTQEMFSVAESVQATVKAGLVVAGLEGGFGTSDSVAEDVKAMFSQQKISSHCTILSMGTIPSIKSNMMKIGVKQFAQFDPGEMMGKLATLQNATAASQQSAEQSADAARVGRQMTSLMGTQVTSVLSSLADVDDGQNKVMDVNTMMTAFEDYVNRCMGADGATVGVPINYYLRTITKSELAQLWVAKYYPQYLAGGGKSDASQT